MPRSSRPFRTALVALLLPTLALAQGVELEDLESAFWTVLDRITEDALGKHETLAASYARALQNAAEGADSSLAAQVESEIERVRTGSPTSTFANLPAESPLARIHDTFAREHAKLCSDFRADAIEAKTAYRETLQAHLGEREDRSSESRRIRNTIARLENADLGEALSIPVAQMRVVSFSSENPTPRERATKAIDGNPKTYWHSQWWGERARPPHELVIDLGGTYEVHGFRYRNRQDGGWNGTFASTEFYLSASEDDFGDRPALATTFEATRSLQPAFLEEAVRGRYLKVRVLTDTENMGFAAASVIEVLGNAVRE